MTLCIHTSQNLSALDGCFGGRGFYQPHGDICNTSGTVFREYLEYLMSSAHRDVTDRFQYTLLTAYIPDEQYIGSVLMSSPYK